MCGPSGHVNSFPLAASPAGRWTVKLGLEQKDDTHVGLLSTQRPKPEWKKCQHEQFCGERRVGRQYGQQMRLHPQYIELEALYKKYKDRNFVILGFPCNQFGNQEPGAAEEIAETCLIRYGVSFPMFAKVDVNGANAHPVFKFLTAALPGNFGSRVKWNFTKFLLGRDGKPVRRFAPITKPSRIDPFLRPVLGT
jgi:glutathione peroxidase